MLEITNKVKEKLAAGQTVYGTFMMGSDPAVGEILGYAGLDFVIVDTEHSSNPVHQAEQIFRALETTGAVPFMRVTANDHARVLQALDSGARGIVIPQVNSAAAAEEAVKAARYYPAGERGLAGIVRAARYGFIPFGDYVKQANNAVMILTQVEHVDAVANLDEILAVKGLDGIFVGPADLSQSMGIPGQINNEEFRATVSDVLQRTKAAGKIAGIFCFNPADAKHWISQGANFVVVAADIMLMSGAARKLVSELNS